MIVSFDSCSSFSELEDEGTTILRNGCKYQSVRRKTEEVLKRTHQCRLNLDFPIHTYMYTYVHIYVHICIQSRFQLLLIEYRLLRTVKV